jgi:dihydroorotate dehydrogenase (fumarate)
MTVELATRYLGLDLRSPIVASAAPHNVEHARSLEDAGVGAIVLPSLFEEEILAEEIELNRSLEQGTEHFAEALSYFPAVEALATAGDRYLTALRRVKAEVDVPIIASLNATTRGGWVRYARMMEEAGADAIELNLYRISANPDLSSADIEAIDLDLISAVARTITIPLAAKLSSHYAGFAHFAREAAERGARGLVLFNRFYQPDLDPETLEVVPRVELSHPSELRLPLRWIAILRPQLARDVSLAATSGIHSGTDAVKAIAVGADVVMLASALLRSGPSHVRAVESQLRSYLEEHEYDSVDQLRGSASQAAVENPTAFERANYMATLRSWTWPDDLEPVAPTR